MFQIGYSRIDITPTESVPLAGFGNTSQRMSNKVLDPLYSTCVALTDEQNNTVLLFHNDLIGSPRLITDPIRKAVSEATGVPITNIIIGSTHTHSAPDVWNQSVPSVPRYNATLPGLLTQCAVEAMADRKPARAFGAKTHTDRLNFVRHYILEDGNYRGDNYGSQYTSPIVGHTTKVDDELRLIKFVREGGEDVLMVNWQVHPLRTGGSSKYFISSDIIGTMRDATEEALDCKFIYFNSGAGNISPLSYLSSEHVVNNYVDHGKAVAKHILSAEGSYEELALGSIRVLENPHIELLNRPNPSQLEAAKEVWAYWAETNNWKDSVALAISKDFHSQFHAGGVIRRYNKEEEEIDCPLTAVSFGDFGLATVPYEMFDTNAKYVRDNSPFKMTFISQTTNASVMYIPSSYGFIHGCYEADSTDCKPGTGERLAGMLVDMLEWTKQWPK